MLSNKLILAVGVIFTALIALSSCSENGTVAENTQNTTPHTIVLDVYKSPLCGCCKDWISHINNNGFQSIVHDEHNVSIIKDKNGIKPNFRSCHTAISESGYVFEGHVPAKFIQKFINETHADDVIGLSVPAMPVGTPGMEIDDKFHPYRILLLKSDGNYEIYADVHSYQEQF